MRAGVDLHDVDDPIAFVRRAVELTGLSLNRTEHEELHAQGLLILCRMAKNYEPGFGGRDPSGSRFSGYAAKYLPGKLRHTWLGSHGYVRVRRTGGRGGWERRVRSTTLDCVSATARPAESDQEHDLAELEHSLRAVLPGRELTVKVGVLFARGFNSSTIAWLLSRPRSEIRACKTELRRVAPRLGLAPEPAQLELFG